MADETHLAEKEKREGLTTTERGENNRQMGRATFISPWRSQSTAWSCGSKQKDGKRFREAKIEQSAVHL